MAWHSDARSLERHGIPREFTTKSRVVIITNDWKTLDRNVAALQDRGHVLLFGVRVAVRREKARIFSGCDSRPDNWSLHPVAIGAAAEVTKPSKPSRQRAALAVRRAGRPQRECTPCKPRNNPMWEPTRLLYGEGRRPWGQEGITPHDATSSRGPTGVLAVACLHTEIRRNTGSPERRVA